MGFYIEPVNEYKEDWLQRNATREMLCNPQWPSKPNEEAIVCLVFNDAHTAAAIAYSMEEFARFTDPKDNRPKLWFHVPWQKIIEVGAMDAKTIEEMAGVKLSEPAPQALRR